MRRLFFLPVMIALASSPALSEPTREEVMAGAERCDGIADNRVWLDCFYGSAQPMRSLLNLPPANPAQVRLVPPRGAEPLYQSRHTASARAAKEETGGFWSAVVGNTRPEASNIALTKYEFDRSGAVTVSLADGQVWRQISADIDVGLHAAIPAAVCAAITSAIAGAETAAIARVKAEAVAVGDRPVIALVAIVIRVVVVGPGSIAGGAGAVHDAAAEHRQGGDGKNGGKFLHGLWSRDDRSKMTQVGGRSETRPELG
jgi:uncharacterized membrane protein